MKDSPVSIKTNTIYNAIKTCSSVLFPLIIFPYILRVLMPDNVGKVDFSASIVSYFNLIASLGISTYAIRECSTNRNDSDKLNNIASQLYSINIISTIISFFLLIITIFFYSKLHNYFVLILIQSISIISNTLSAEWINSAMEDFKYITIRTLVLQLFSLILILMLVKKPDDYLKYVVIGLITSVGGCLYNIRYRRKYCKITFLWRIKYDIDWKRHLPPVLMMFAMLLAQTIFNNIDISMLGIMRGDYEVGIYSTAYKISNILNQLVFSVLWVIMPRMSLYYSEGDYSSISKLCRKILCYNTTIGLPCAIGVILLSDDIILIFAGKEYSESSMVLKVLMLGLVFSLYGGGYIGNCILLPSKKEKIFMIVCCVAAIENIITNYYFIPRFGVVAAASTSVFCAFTIFILLLFFMDKRITIINKVQIYISPIIGCVGIVVVCLCLRYLSNITLRVVFSVFISIFIYFCILYFLRNELLIEVLKDIKKYIKSE